MRTTSLCITSIAMAALLVAAAASAKQGNTLLTLAQPQARRGAGIGGR